MKLLKPEWVHHNEKPIFSILDGTKFATGGQGSRPEGLVVIWNLKPVLSPDAKFNKSIPKILCRLENHLACVNCVRWSMNSLYLASGGDDKVVMIWKKGWTLHSIFYHHEYDGLATRFQIVVHRKSNKDLRRNSVAHLASHGTEKRIRFLLDDLLGPTTISVSTIVHTFRLPRAIGKRVGADCRVYPSTFCVCPNFNSQRRQWIVIKV